MQEYRLHGVPNVDGQDVLTGIAFRSGILCAATNNPPLNMWLLITSRAPVSWQRYNRKRVEASLFKRSIIALMLLNALILDLEANIFEHIIFITVWEQSHLSCKGLRIEFLIKKLPGQSMVLIK